MNKSFFPLFLLTSTGIQATNPFDHMHAAIENMRQMHVQLNRSFDQMYQQMNESFADVSNQLKERGRQWSIEFEEAEESVILKIRGVKTNAVDATLDEEKDMMRIKTDEGLILVYSTGKAVQVTIRQERNTEKTNQSNYQAVSVNQSSIARTIGSEIDLEESNIDYHQEESLLALKISKKKRKSKAKSLPVTIK